MAIRVPLTLYEFNDETVHAVILDASMNPLDCTGKSVEFVYKTDTGMSEAAAIRLPGIFTDALVGACDFSVPSQYVLLANKFYRIDVISNGIRKTAAYGPVTVVDL